MLEFTEKLYKELRLLKRDTEDTILGGRVTDMSQYRYLMGRLEGYKFVEDMLQRLLKDYSSD